MRALVLALAVTTVARAAPAPGGASPPPLPRVTATFEHSLSSTTGVVALTWASVAQDRERAETYVVSDGYVRIFNAAGMEVHRFGDDGSLGHVERAVSLDGGDIVVLTTVDGRRAYLRCNFKGELVARFGLAGLPEALDDFQPDQLVHRNGNLYFAERSTMRVVVTDVEGTYRRSFQLRDLVAAALPPDAEKKPSGSMDAFNVDAAGNLLFTISAMFTAGIASPEGGVRLFGSRGSTPGKFNIVGGIDADESGALYLTDRLRSVVSVWSRDLRHLADFGYRGGGDGNLLTPYEIAAGNGRVFVAQAAKRGVKVFRVEIVEPPPAEPPPPDPRQREDGRGERSR